MKNNMLNNATALQAAWQNGNEKSLSFMHLQLAQAVNLPVGTVAAAFPAERRAVLEQHVEAWRQARDGRGDAAVTGVAGAALMLFGGMLAAGGTALAAVPLGFGLLMTISGLADGRENRPAQEKVRHDILAAIRGADEVPAPVAAKPAGLKTLL